MPVTLYPTWPPEIIWINNGPLGITPLETRFIQMQPITVLPGVCSTDGVLLKLYIGLQKCCISYKHFDIPRRLFKACTCHVVMTSCNDHVKLVYRSISRVFELRFSWLSAVDEFDCEIDGYSFIRPHPELGINRRKSNHCAHNLRHL